MTLCHVICDVYDVEVTEHERIVRPCRLQVKVLFEYVKDHDWSTTFADSVMISADDSHD